MILLLFTKPFQSETFDFSDEVFFENIFIRGTLCQRPKSQKDEWKSWIKHFIYINRTFFGLYNLMFDLKSTIKVNDYLRY
jgi:hypothetical protein